MTNKELFEAYKKDVYKTCFFMLHHPDDAEDVCQDVFITVFKTDWHEIEHVKTWLMRIAVNHCLNHLKKTQRLKNRETKFGLLSNDAAHKPVEDIIEQREAAMECVHLLQVLPDTIRAAVSLRYLHDLSLAEIAAILDIPVGTVKSRLHKGLKEMKKKLESGARKQPKEEYAYEKSGKNVFSFFRR